MNTSIQTMVGLPSIFLATALATACGSSSPPGAEGSPVNGDTGSGGPFELRVLSNRPQLISGGDALIEVVLPGGAAPETVLVTMDGRDVSDDFALRPNGRFMGVVNGLAEGDTDLAARLGDGTTRQITITNHPIGGPIFSGPQIQPWPCLDGADDLQCNRPTTYEFLYMPAIGGGLQDYDPDNPPSDVANTTTDHGNTVPFIVRVETGSQNRSQYKIAVLFDPAQDWKPWAPQDGWNGKTMNYGGSGCGNHYGETEVSQEFMDEDALSRGVLTWETALSHNTNNCNLVVQAESLMMAKERIVEAYGPIRYTIGMGGSGGSIKLQQAANAYPGIYDGIVPHASFTDTWSTGAGEVLDCRYLVDYFAEPLSWGVGVTWLEPQQAAVMGHPTTSICQAWINLFAFDWAFNPRSEAHEADPVHQIVDTQNCNVTEEQAWNEETNPSGVRCALADHMRNVLGSRPEDGNVRVPIDNVGIQYGLNALVDGEISVAQFLDLNAKIGSRDVNYNRVATRAVADPGAIATAYRGGLFNQGNNMHLPIIDLRGHNNVEIHHNWHSYEMRERLLHSNGHHDNHFIWFNPTTASEALIPKAVPVMDAWLTAIEADTSNTPYEQRVIENKPADARDLCAEPNGNELPEDVCRTQFPYFFEPRVVAGEPLHSDIAKCQLKPLNMADYPSGQFTAEQWQEMQVIFPDGVCDYDKPDVDRQPTVAWMDYTNGPGGEPMPDTPIPAGWASEAFRGN